MAWDDQQPPWGKPGRPSTPEDLIAALINKLKQSFSRVVMRKPKASRARSREIYALATGYKP